MERTLSIDDLRRHAFGRLAFRTRWAAFISRDELAHELGLSVERVIAVECGLSDPPDVDAWAAALRSDGETMRARVEREVVRIEQERSRAR